MARDSDAIDELNASIDRAWAAHRARSGAPDEAPDGATDDAAEAAAVLEDPSRHPWRLVDAALDRLGCDACGAPSGSGERGCGPCDLADGFRFAAREVDREGVPPGNEHALRVSAAVLRAPHRYPAWVVESNRVLLPLFMAGDMPTRPEQERLLAARDAGRPLPEPGEASTFADLVDRVAGRRD